MYYHRGIGGNNGRKDTLPEDKKADFFLFAAIFQIASGAKLYGHIINHGRKQRQMLGSYHPASSRSKKVY
jgi:hypothetical protein